MLRIAFVALVLGCLGGCSPPYFRTFPGNYPPVFSPSAAGKECAATPITMECTTRPDVIDPNQ